MKKRLKIESLVLLGTRKNYTVNFHDGFNLISGHTSTGKTSILEMIDYALGAQSHKSYIEIGNSCSHVELTIVIGDEKFRVRRELFNFKAPVVVEDWREDKNKFLFYNRYEIDVPSNPKSLSAFLIEKLGLANLSISGQTFSFRDLFKYCYIKQTEIDNEDILGEKNWTKDFKRKATFEIIFNVYDNALEEYKRALEERKQEVHDLALQITGIQNFLKTVDIVDSEACKELEKSIRKEITELSAQLAEIKKGKGNISSEAIALRRRIEEIKSQITDLEETHRDQEQYLKKLRLLYNQYLSEVDKKELAIQGYLTFNQYEFLSCPNCLRPIKRTENAEVCCLCGSEKSDDTAETLILKNEISVLKRKANELLKFIEAEDRKYDAIIHEIHELRSALSEAEIELNHLSQGYIDPIMEQIEYINYEIGLKNRRLFELEKNSKMFREVERLSEVFKKKEESVELLKANIKALTANAVDKQTLMEQLSNTLYEILKAFEYPKLSTAYIDDKRYLPYVRGRKYNDIGSLAGVTLITMAYYMALLIVGSSKEYYHPNLLIIDSPRKNLGAQNTGEDDEEFKDEKIFNATIRHLYNTVESRKNDIQMIVVNNGYPDFLPHECVVAEFDAEELHGLPKGLIDDAIN